MSINLTIYASDVRGLEDEIERSFDISNYYGTALFCPMTDRLVPREQYESKYPYAIEPHTYLAVLMDMQQQINELKEELNEKW